ncbi:hypothetical protein ACFYXH_02425 [Streptomyces sp. NPDC002730]|uniref:hypothetical protein n=1 Tax=Streptomyces sp. NPDC002730 TaxID=3364662 RepID=UPI0036B1A3BC
MAEPSHLRVTRAFYDAVAVDYAERYRTGLEAKPLDRALLAASAERVRADGAGPVADLGCGPGRVTAHVHSLGLNAFGVDLSPAAPRLPQRAPMLPLRASAAGHAISQGAELCCHPADRIAPTLRR